MKGKKERRKGKLEIIEEKKESEVKKIENEEK